MEQRRTGLRLGLGLTALLLVGTIVLLYLAYLAKDLPRDETSRYFDDQPPDYFTVLLWAATAGWVGGAGRAMFRFIWEVGGCAEEEPSDYLNRWFLYLFKPPMGIAGGLFFFLAVNLGFIGLFSSRPALGFLHVCLTGVLGGVFFENVFAVLSQVTPRGRAHSNVLE